MNSIWNERYNVDNYIFGTEPNDFIKSVFLSYKTGRVLSLGEGEGRNSLFLAKMGFEVTSIDGSIVAKSKAEQLYKNENVHVDYICKEIEPGDVRAKEYDYIVSVFCHLPSELRKKIHSELNKNFKTGSYFVFEGYSKEQFDYDTGGPKNLDMLIDLDEIMGELTDFEFIVAQKIKRFVHEGQGHTGLSSVVQLLARKK